MGKYESISDEHRAFIERQPMFFVASAPLSESGHVNVSPKGLDALRIIDTRTVMYLDLTGSGNETAAHIAENGRVTLLFCAFEGSPKILRLYCRGRVVTRSAPEAWWMRSWFRRSRSSGQWRCQTWTTRLCTRRARLQSRQPPRRCQN